MKEMLKKTVEVLKMIFGYGIMITLFAGGATFFGYLAALFIGGTTATEICVFIYEEIMPVIVYASTTMIVLGLLIMYLSGETALTASKKSKKKQSS